MLEKKEFLYKSSIVLLVSLSFGLLVDLSSLNYPDLISELISLTVYKYLMMGIGFVLILPVICLLFKFKLLDYLRGGIAPKIDSYWQKSRQVPSTMLFVLYFSNYINYFFVPFVIFSLAEFFYALESAER